GFRLRTYVRCAADARPKSGSGGRGGLSFYFQITVIPTKPMDWRRQSIGAWRNLLFLLRTCHVNSGRTRRTHSRSLDCVDPLVNERINFARDDSSFLLNHSSPR